MFMLRWSDFLGILADRRLWSKMSPTVTCSSDCKIVWFIGFIPCQIQRHHLGTWFRWINESSGLTFPYMVVMSWSRYWCIDGTLGWCTYILSYWWLLQCTWPLFMFPCLLLQSIDALTLQWRCSRNLLSHVLMALLNWKGAFVKLKLSNSERWRWLATFVISGSNLFCRMYESIVKQLNRVTSW